jgi:hypothetical protein
MLGTRFSVLTQINALLAFGTVLKTNDVPIGMQALILIKCCATGQQHTGEQPE